MTEVLSLELQTFESRLPELLATIRGQIGEVATFALVKGESITGTFVSQQDAINKGYGEHGNVPFLVKEITESPKIVTFSRGI